MRKTLLHVCCAPCSTSAIETLQKTADIDAFFYNPNIHSVSEYTFRAEEMQVYGKTLGLIVKEGDYDIEEWFLRIKGLEWESEKSRKRCEKCIQHRLEKTAKKAKEEGYEAFTTALTISPHKDASQVNRLGREISEAVGIDFIETDLKQQGGFQRSVVLTKEKGIRRQNYCGCVFSRLERNRHAKIKR